MYKNKYFQCAKVFPYKEERIVKIFGNEKGEREKKK